MKKIFIIKSTLVDKRTGLTNKNEWGNIYAVENELEARKCCIRAQSRSNNEHDSMTFKMVYMYEKLEVF